jgi:hypothetical protein
MADRKKGTGTWTESEVASNYELNESQLLQAETVDQLSSALEAFTDNHLGIHNLMQMYQLAGPARVVSLALRGYELPDAVARYHSSNALLAIDAVLQQVDRRGELAEQVWLILAAQQDILLQQLENDLEALYEADDSAVVKDQRDVLGRVHSLLRKRSNIAIEHMFEVGKYA